MFPVAAGGGADKRGGRYESRWTIWHGACPVLDGRAEAITVEPLGAAGVGIEFRVHYPGSDEVHQVKRQRAASSWTINALEDEGVLVAFGTHLADPDVRAVFVSGTEARDLDALAAGARLPFDNFRSKLTTRTAPALGELCRVWGVEDAAAHERLSRLDVHLISESTLAIAAIDAVDRVVDDRPDDAIELLFGFLLDNLFRRVPASEMWDRLRKAGIRPRRGADVSSSETARDVADRYEKLVSDRRPQRLPLIGRPEVDQVADFLLDPSGPRTVLVVGAPGTGKSTVVAGAVNRLRADGVVVAPLSLDSAGLALSAVDLGKQPAIGYGDSPVRVLARAAAGDATVLVVDQLDALSALSGRGEGTIAAVRDLLQQKQAAERMKLLVACRTYDLDHDMALREVLGDDADRVTVMIGELTDAQLAPILAGFGIVDASAATLRPLVRNPFYLSLLARLVDDPEVDLDAVRSPADLLKACTTHYRRHFKQNFGPEKFISAVREVARITSSRAELSVPLVLVLPDEPDLRDALLAEGVFVSDGQRARFFHESYFDFIYAEQHVAEGGTAASLLRDDPQDLVRRGQVRAILALERDQMRDIYHSDLDSLIGGASTVRMHLVAAVLAWVGSLPELDDNELDSLLRAAAPTAPRLRRHALATLGGAGGIAAVIRRGLFSALTAAWIDMRAANGTVAGEGPWRGWSLGDLSWLVLDASRSHPEDAAAAARAVLSASQNVADLALPFVNVAFLAGPGAGEETVGLYVDVCNRIAKAVGSTPPELPTDEAVRLVTESLMEHALHTLATRCPARAAPAIAAWLNALEAVTLAAGGRHLFDPNAARELNPRPGLDTLPAIARHAPAAFVESVLPIVLRTAGAAAYEPSTPARTGPTLHSDTVWRRYSLRSQLSDVLLEALGTAIEAAAASDPEAARQWLSRAAGSDLVVGHILAGRAYAQADERLLSDALTWASRPDVRQLKTGTIAGWAWGEVLARLASADDLAIRTAVFELASNAYQSIDLDAVREAPTSRSEADLDAYDLAVEQLVALTLIAARTSDLPADVRERAATLESLVGPVPESPYPRIMSGAIVSPVADSAAEAFTDDRWLTTIREHSSLEPAWTRNPFEGGAHQVAGQLEAAAGKDPARFAALLARIPSDAAPPYAARLLHAVTVNLNLAEPEQRGKLIDAVTAAAARPAPPLAELCEAIGRLADGTLPGEFLNFVASVAAGETTAAEAEDYSRYTAVIAIARLVAQPAFRAERAEFFTPALRAAARDTAESVRSAVPTALYVLWPTSPDLAADLAGDWISSGDEVAAAPNLGNLAIRVAMSHPSLTRTIVSRTLASREEQVVRDAGSVAAALVFNDQRANRTPSPFNDVLEQALANDTARIGVAEVVAHWVDDLPEVADADRPVSRPLLLTLLDDASPDVRSSAAYFVQDLGHPLGDYATLFAEVAQIREFDTFADTAFYGLIERANTAPTVILNLAERWLADHDGAPLDITTSAPRVAWTLDELVLAVHAASSPNSPDRSRALDLLDRLIELGSRAFRALDEA